MKKSKPNCGIEIVVQFLFSLAQTLDEALKEFIVKINIETDAKVM